jgi:uncharacterized protein (DUF2062 family)
LFQRRVALRPLQKLREKLWPSAGWKRAAQYTWYRLTRLPGTPHAIALGLAIGVFVSWTPFLGFHIIIAMALSWVLRANMLASFIGTFFGTPLTFPIIWLSTFELGNLLLGYPGQAVPENLADMLFSSHGLDVMLPILLPMAVGSVPIGIAVGLISYFIARAALAAFKARRSASLQERANLRAAVVAFDIPEQDDEKRQGREAS